MSSKKYMNLDEYDSRVALYSDEAFTNGITFGAKFIGSCEIPRPSSRLEIVASMRRLRYECKSKSVKKKKILLTISTDGVRVSTKENSKNPVRLVFLEHQIHRIFYVSHDSLEKKIFSYIARDSSSFRCCVFKTNKKAQAMRIVRTIGQVFEVCHKLSVTYVNNQVQECISSQSKDKRSDSHLKSVDSQPAIDTQEDCDEARPTSRGAASTSEEVPCESCPTTRSTGCQAMLLPSRVEPPRECNTSRQVTSSLQRLESAITSLANRLSTLEENQIKMMSYLVRSEQLLKQRSQRADNRNKKRESIFSPPSLGFDSSENSLSIFSSGISSQTPSPPSNTMNIITPTFSDSKHMNDSSSELFCGLFD